MSPLIDRNDEDPDVDDVELDEPPAYYDTPAVDAGEAVVPFEDTELVAEWEQSVKYGAADDYVIALTASSLTGVSGTGKTTAGICLAKYFDLSGGFDAEEQGTLDPSTLAYEILPATRGGEAIMFEEAQGSPEHTGLDARRAMKDEVIDTIQAVLANRDQELTLIIVAQQLSMIDTRLYPLIDAWLLIRYAPPHPKGPLMTHHDLIVDDFDFNNPDIRTPANEDLEWPHVPKNDPAYRVMEKKKQEAKGSLEDPDAEEQIPQEARDNIIRRLDTIDELTQQQIGDIFDLSRGQVNRICNR